jgi:hypothetical protein
MAAVRLSTRCSWCGHESIAAGTAGPALDEAHRQQVREHRAEHVVESGRAAVLEMLRGSLWWADR